MSGSVTATRGQGFAAGQEAAAGLLRVLDRLAAETLSRFGDGLASLARDLTGARGAQFFESGASWTSAGAAGTVPESLEVPRDLVDAPVFGDSAMWLPLAAEGEIHGVLAVFPAPRDRDAQQLALSLARLAAPILAAKRMSRQAKIVEFELKERVLELESLYDLVLALGTNLNFETLAEEVLMRSISLTDARRGSLVLFGEDGSTAFSRSFGGQLLTREVAASWQLPEEGAVVASGAGAVPTGGVAPAECHQCLAVSIAANGRRLGVLAVADKETREGIVDFRDSDGRLLSLFANQAAIALQTARHHRDALEKERLQRELELAAAIQRAILPKELPHLRGFAFGARNRPTYQVGGDYYDFFPLADGRFAFAVADVSGKGVPAALLVFTVHSGLHLQIDASTDLADLVARLHRHLRQYSDTGKYITLFFGLVDPERQTLTYVSAGHSPALLVRADGSSRELHSTGLPVGLLPDAVWTAESVALWPGDRICVYSDGITEAVDAGDREFGIDRLRELVRELRGEPPEVASRRILDAVAEHAQGVPQYDDQTVLLLAKE